MRYKFRALVVSGDDEFRAELVERATALDFSVRAIRSGEELPEFLKGRHFDWLFLDVDLGREACLGIIDTLGAGWRPRTVLVGAIDAADGELIRRSAVRAGLDVVRVLAKPPFFADMSMTLSSLVAREAQVPHDDLARERFDAIPVNEIEVQYQPIVSMPGRVVSRIEALVRWRHPEHGLIGPDQFIGLAEQSGAIVALTWEVLTRAVEQQVAWKKQGLVLSVSVNVSTLTLTAVETAAEILALLDARGMDPHSLILEITETERARYPAVARSLLTRLRAAGVGISMDDYGVGYSDLGRLQYYPFSDLKMDRGLVARLPGNPESMDIASMLASLAAREGVTLTGEGIETQEQWDTLEAIGCDFAQGFLIARPMPADEVAGWIGKMALAGRFRPPQAAD
jgi:EAL domain-containing protein (putative c-di-GMP-specific phosphodiesterase class I)